MNVKVISVSTKRRMAQVVVHTPLGTVKRNGKPAVVTQTRHVPLTKSGGPDLAYLNQRMGGAS